MKTNIVVTSLLVSGGTGFRRENARVKEIERRIGVLTGLASRCADSDLVLLPAGFFCAPGEAAASRIATRAHEALRAAEARATFIYGVDAWLGDKSAPQAAPSGYPFFIVVSLPNVKEPSLLRQIAISAAEGREIAVLDQRWSVGAGKRCIDMDGSLVSVLICGETWSNHLHSKVAEMKPAAVVIPAHRAIKTGRGPRSWEKPLRDLVRRVGAPVILAEHTRSGGIHKRVWGKVVTSDSREDRELQAHVVTTTVGTIPRCQTLPSPAKPRT